MKSDVELILKLQNIDLQIIDLEGHEKIIPVDIEKLEKDKKDLKNEYLVFEEDIKKLKLKQKDLDVEIESKKDKLHKYEVQLNTIKTNKEYTAMLEEIKNAKVLITSTEDKVLEIMEKLEEKLDIKKEKEKELKEKETFFDNEIKEKQKELFEIQNEIKKLKDDRKLKASECQSSLFNRYERFINKKHSIALVPLEQNGACSGCHRNLPPNIRNEVMKAKIIQCENCSRLIYWDEKNNKNEEEVKEEG